MPLGLAAIKPRKKAVIFTGVVGVALLGLAFYSIWMIQGISVAGPDGKFISSRQSVISDLAPSAVDLSIQRRIAFQLMLQKDRVSALRAELDSAKAALLSRYGDFEALLPEGDAKKLLLGKALQSAKKYLDVLDNEYIPLLRADNTAQAQRVLQDNLEPFWSEYNGILLQAVNAERSEQEMAQNLLRNKLTELAIVVAVVLIVLLVFIAVVALRMARPEGAHIGGVVDIAERISAGEIVPDLQAAENSNNEVGRLQNALHRINEYHAALEGSALKIATGNLESQVEVASQHDRLGAAIVKLAGCVKTAQAELNRSNKELAFFLGQYSNQIQELSIGNLTVKINEESDNVFLKQMAVSTNRLTDALRDVAKSAGLIAKGDLTATVTVRSDKDEMGTALEQMAARFRAFVGEVKLQSEELAKASNGLLALTDQYSQMISQLSMTSSQISSSTSSVAQSSQNASMLSRAVDGASRQGKDLMAKLVEKIRMVKEAEDTSGTAMNNLSSRSAQIGEIVSVITKIADQTNLLSLNAAIEAARAGEAGHGFAVVADEVRKLAESSAQSAQEISRIIKEVQDETKNAVHSAASGRKEIEEGIALTDQSNERFGVIVSQIEGMNKQIEVIASAAEQTAASAQEAAAATEEQTAAIEEVSSDVTHMADVARSLSNAVSAFKV